MNKTPLLILGIIVILIGVGIGWVSIKSKTFNSTPPAKTSPSNTVLPANNLMAPDTVSGHYERVSGDPASLDVQLVNSGQVRIQGNATWEGDVSVGQVNVGEIDGTIALNGNNAIYKKDPCELTLIFHNGSVSAADNLACGGLNVSFTGDYAKIDNATNPATDQENQAADLVLKQKEVQNFKARLDQQKISTLGIRVESTPTSANPTYAVHVFESFPDHEATFNWYAVNLETGTVQKQF